MSKGGIYVGRVGALAVALGVGMAVTSTQSLAWAIPDSTGEGAESPGEKTSAESTPGDDDKEPATESESQSKADPASPGESRTNHPLRLTIHTFGPRSLFGRDDGRDGPHDATDITNLVRAFESPRQRRVLTARSNDSAPTILETKKAPYSPTSKTAQQDLQSILRQTISSITKTSASKPPVLKDTARTPTVPLTAPVTQRQAAVVAPVPLPPPAPANGGAAFSALPRAIVKTIAGVANVVLGGLSAPMPGAPPDSPVMWAVLAVVRRQFFNQAPEFESRVRTPDSVGNVRIDLDRVDADGDTLNYTINGVDKGTVVPSGDGHTFTYIPNKGATGIDEVTITATEASADNIHGLPGLLHALSFGVLGDSGRTVTKTVTVILNTPPEFSSVADPETDENGIVTGTVTFADADGDAVTYSAPASTNKGDVVIDSTGKYTYTPKPGQRFIAAGATGDYTDTFTVTATDGHGGTGTKDVTVTIKPAVVTSANAQDAYNAAQAAIAANSAAYATAKATFSDTVRPHMTVGSQIAEASAQGQLLAGIAGTYGIDTAEQKLAEARAEERAVDQSVFNPDIIQTLLDQNAAIIATLADMQASLTTAEKARSFIDAPSDPQAPAYQKVEYTVNADRSITGKVYFVDPQGQQMIIDDTGVGLTDYFVGDQNSDGTFFIPAPAAGDNSNTVAMTFGAHDQDENFSGAVTLTLDRSTPTVIPADTPDNQMFTKTSGTMAGLSTAIGSNTTLRNDFLAEAQAAEAEGKVTEAEAARNEARNLDDDIANQVNALNALREQFLASIGT